MEKTCKGCFHYQACKGMLEAQGIHVSGDHCGNAENCDTFVSIKNVVSVGQYESLLQDRDHLLKIASAMHLWIFKHVFDEAEVYAECGLSPQDDARLGYGGEYRFEVPNENT